MKNLILVTAFLLSGLSANAVTDDSNPSDMEKARLKTMVINHPKNGSYTSFINDAEEQNSMTAYWQGAPFAYARGYNGLIYRRTTSGSLISTTPAGSVIVAVIDSGVDTSHQDLDNSVLKSKAVMCTYTKGCFAYTKDTDGHGTNVAGVIAAEKNGVGMHGVAYGAKILPIAAILNSGDGSDLSGYNYALDQGAKVINASYGLELEEGEIPIYTSKHGDAAAVPTPSSIQAYLAAKERGISWYNVMDKVISKDAIVVFASGNAGMDQVGILAGLPYYFSGNLASKPFGYATINPTNKDISKNWVTAGTVNVDVVGGNTVYTIASYSNKCGVAKNWCLFAPFASNLYGYADNAIYSTKKGGGYEYNFGTSFAAPSVSGAIAVMEGAFPHLKAKDILNILYNTATDIGAPGVDWVYGRGVINLSKATNPSDSKWKITLSSAYTTTTKSFESSGLNLSSAFGDAIGKAAKQDVMFLDEYDKNYNISLGALLGQSSTNRISADQLLAEFGQGELTSRVNLGAGMELGFASSAESYDNMGRIQDPAMDTENEFKASFSSTVGSEKGVVTTNKFTHNLNLANEATSSVLDTNINNQFAHSQAFKNPYLGIAESVDAGMFEYKKNGLGFKSGAFFGKAGKDNYEFENNKGIRGSFSELSYSKKGSGIALGVGLNIEDNTFLGAESSGALKLGDNSKTFYSNLSGKYKVTSRLALLGSYNIGVTKMDIASNSLFKNNDQIVTDSFSFGGEYNGIMKSNDSLLLSVSQPLRVRSGGANISLPTGIDANGMVSYTNTKLDLSPEGRELDLEAYYKAPLEDSDAELKFGTIYRMSPDNFKEAPDEAVFLAKYKQVF